MATLLDWIQMGGIAVPILIALLLLFLPVSFFAVLFSFVAAPTRGRVRRFACLFLVAGVVFLAVGATGYAAGAAAIREFIATSEVPEPETLMAIGLGEARIPLVAGGTLGAVALLAAGLLMARANRLDSGPRHLETASPAGV